MQYENKQIHEQIEEINTSVEIGQEAVNRSIQRLGNK